MQVVKPYRLLSLVMTSVIVIVVVLAMTINKKEFINIDVIISGINKELVEWRAPDINQLPASPESEMIRYGRDLIANTSFFLGPKGKVASISNGMNCQNCHLDAGTREWGNNYSAVFSTYPRFRERSGSLENIHKRVNDCIERSLNGTALDTNSREMKAFAAYINWLGQNVPKGKIPVGTGLRAVPFLKRPADPRKGKNIYMQSCQRCHGLDGAGLFNSDSSGYIYPPLWGEHSYNVSAGLYRLTRLAGYLRENMPFDAPKNAAHLTDEEAWDIAAFVNSQPRPEKKFNRDWPNISGKPVDHPFGPYSDSFPETQHKYGPFEPIRLAHSQAKKAKDRSN